VRRFCAYAIDFGTSTAAPGETGGDVAGKVGAPVVREPVENRDRLEEERPDLHTIVLDASGVNHLDATADHELRKLAAHYRERGIRLMFVNVDDDVRDVMDASGLSELVGTENFFATNADAVSHLDTRP
jgi:anti-anti-sigma regulatory factor